ncbi:MAG: exopolysaccharide biosynthesis protein [Gammaproteobacteria bacterium]|nr:exopolysaccharide biosynthesis protein [Gammaproteobacteria bacterium]
MDDLLDKTTGEVSVGDVVNKFESRGFGPFLLLPALIALLPTGAIPGVPSICGVTLCIICLQMAFGDEHPLVTRRPEESLPNTNPHSSLPTQQDCQAFWLGLVAQVWWFQIKQA